MAIEQPKVNKTAFVRNVLQQIGAITANPPEGWRQKVEEALAKQSLSMHQVTIYQIRQKAMKEASGLVPPAKAKPGRPKAAPKAAASKTVASKAPVKGSLTVADLQAVVEFSKRFGGINGLSEAVAAIKSFS
jgi:hypothetical protein